jgi:hypothetical protein
MYYSGKSSHIRVSYGQVILIEAPCSPDEIGRGSVSAVTVQDLSLIAVCIVLLKNVYLHWS